MEISTRQSEKPFEFSDAEKQFNLLLGKQYKQKITKSPEVSPRATPPFPALPSFNCAATILAYVGHDEEVGILCNDLSHNAANYFKTHETILRGFVDEYPLLKQKALGVMDITYKVNEVVENVPANSEKMSFMNSTIKEARLPVIDLGHLD